MAVQAIAAIEQGLRRFPYPRTVRALAAALGLSSEEQAAFTRMARRLPPHRSAPARAVETLRSTNPPVLRLPLLGREREVEELRELLLDPAVGLVSVTGIGGVGKTVLALQVAADLRNSFRDGVWLVELADLADPALVGVSAARTLGMPEPRGLPSVPAVVAALAEKHLLLVLDNCEHLVEACAELAERVLTRCPEVHVLVTSREPLLIPGERQVRLAPLATPELQARPSLDDVAQSPAVQLFVARARDVSPTFTLTKTNAAAVASVCTRLNGLPLALELAAARVRVLGPEQIMERMDDLFGLLVGGNRLAPTRHQSLQAALDWSYVLLGQAERAGFRRLAVFAGGCEVRAAEAVCAGVDLPPGAVLDVLGNLVDKSLVLTGPDPANRRRLRQLEAVREYGRRRLEESGEAELVRQHHAEWFVAVAEGLAPDLWASGRVAALDTLEREQANLRAALDWLTESHQVDLALRLATAIQPLWASRGAIGEGREGLAQLLRLPPGSGSATAALLAAAYLAWTHGDYEAQRQHAQDSLSLARHLQEPRATTAALATSFAPDVSIPRQST